MSHHERRALSDKQNVLNMFNHRMKAKVKSSSTGISAPCCNSVCSKKKTEEHCSAPQKVKRFKTIKQRNQIRGESSNRFNHSHQHYKRGSKEKAQCNECHDCHCSCSLNTSRKEKPVAKQFPPQKPSIITEGRLTSIRGLFSHEVRSVDIERLVKEKERHIELEEGQAAASNSPSLSSPPPLLSETSEGGISTCAKKDQRKSKTSEKTDHLQINSEGTVPVTMHSRDGKHSSAKTHEATGNAARCGSPSSQKGTEAVILSLSESEPVDKSFPTSVKSSQNDNNVTPKKKNTHDQQQAKKTTAAMDMQNDFVNTQRHDDNPARSEVLNMDAPQSNSSPAIFMISSPTLDRERSVLRDKSQHRKYGASPEREVVSRLAARLCHTVGSFPMQHCCPPLTECRTVLLQYLQERHGSQLQHNLRRLHSHLNEEVPHSPDFAEQALPSSAQKYLDTTQMYFSNTGEYEDDQRSGKMEFQADNGSQRDCVGEGFCQDLERVAACKRRRKQAWGTYSPQDFLTKLQPPCQDTLSQWSIKVQSQKHHQHSNSQTFSLHQAFTEPQTPTPCSYNCTDLTLDAFYLVPQKQVKLGSGENTGRHGTALLEQWRNDPDLSFLFQGENTRRAHTSLDPLTELRGWSPRHNTESVSERALLGASSTVSALFPPEGFHYEPYFRFPHPSNSFNRSERSAMTLYTRPDVEQRGLSPSLNLTTPYLQYWS